MRTIPCLLLAALTAAGCAARLPTPEAATAPAASPERASFMTPVSDEWVSRAVVPASEHAAAGHEIYEGAEEEEFYRHELALFLGYTFERGEGGFTIGLDYMYKINETFGVGPFIDYVAGDLDALAIGAGVYIRPFRCARDLTFFVGPGVDLVHEEEIEEGHAEEHGGSPEKTWEADFLIRLGVTYGFDLGRGYRLVPAFYYDIIGTDSHAYVVGLSFGKEF